MKISTIQVKEDTKRRLEERKIHPRESYDEVLRRMLQNEDIPSMEEMFRRADEMGHREYSTAEIIRISHELRERR